MYSLLAVAAEEGPVDPSNVGVGSVVLTIAAAAFLAWVGYLFLNSRRRKREAEETPQNLQPYLSDDELETNRITRVLNIAVVSAAVLAVALPVYFVNEGDRQVAAAEKIHEKDVEEGHHWYEVFSCINCHGPDGGGGAAPFVEARSGLDVAWTAPSINDVFLRFDEEEVRHWIEFGRAGTPMPASGLEGGGAMTVQEVDQILEYLQSIQIPQGQAVDEVEGIVDDALARIAGGDAAVTRRIIEEQASLNDIQDAPGQFAVIEDFPTEVRFLMADDGTCTDESAAAVGSSCGDAGTDTDRDGLTDAVERRLTEIGGIIDETVLVRQVSDQVDDEGSPVLDDEGNRIPQVDLIPDPSLSNMYGLELDPGNAFTNSDLTGTPIEDLVRVESFLLDLDTAHLTLGVITERQDVFLARVEQGLAFLERAAQERLWDIDFDEVAADSGLTRSEAERAVGLFNGYCARCHTGGYQAGVAFEQGPGSGAWGPSLLDGRSVVQFPDAADQVQFIIRGSVNNENYGINGLGSGRMPGFGQILSAEDIELIVAYERSM
jgi:mono/diheme cytochrome c family protein